MVPGPKCASCVRSRNCPASGEVMAPCHAEIGRFARRSGLRRQTRTSVPLVALALVVALLGAVLPAAADPGDEDASGASLDPDVVAGKQAIDQKNWAAAIKALSSAALRDTRNADIQNYLGYAHRNAGQMDQAFVHYERALKLNPRHRGAHEYVGEAYLMVGKLAQAEGHLKALQAICLLPCEELDDLKAKIDRYRQEGHKP